MVDLRAARRRRCCPADLAGARARRRDVRRLLGVRAREARRRRGRRDRRRRGRRRAVAAAAAASALRREADRARRRARARVPDRGRGARARSVERVVCDVRDARRPTRSAGRSTSRSVGALLLHLRDPVGALERMRATLAPGGSLVLLEPVAVRETLLAPRRPVARFEPLEHDVQLVAAEPRRAARLAARRRASTTSSVRGFHRPPRAARACGMLARRAGGAAVRRAPAPRELLLGAADRVGAAQALGAPAQPALRHPLRGPGLLGPGFASSAPEGGTFVVGPDVEFRRGFRVELHKAATVRDRRRDGVHLRRAHPVLEHDRHRRALHVRPVDRSSSTATTASATSTGRCSSRATTSTPIRIADDAVVTTKCTIIADLGKRAWIGANSVVTKPVPDYSVAAGVARRRSSSTSVPARAERRPELLREVRLRARPHARAQPRRRRRHDAREPRAAAARGAPRRLRQPVVEVRRDVGVLGDERALGGADRAPSAPPSPRASPGGGARPRRAGRSAGPARGRAGAGRGRGPRRGTAGPRRSRRRARAAPS